MKVPTPVTLMLTSITPFPYHCMKITQDQKEVDQLHIITNAHYGLALPTLYGVAALKA